MCGSIQCFDHLRLTIETEQLITNPELIIFYRPFIVFKTSLPGYGNLNHSASVSTYILASVLARYCVLFLLSVNPPAVVTIVQIIQAKTTPSRI